ncbi:MAG: nucleotide sugar dehydrogenase [Acidimicrobiales bacterium]
MGQGARDLLPAADAPRLDVCVVGGCGHVGLPLALSFAHAGLDVGIYDISEVKVAQVAAGRPPFLEQGVEELLAEALAGGNLAVSCEPPIVSRADVVVLVVGTPIDEFLNPSLRVFDRVLDDIEPHLADGSLLVLRSTVYPGATDWVASALASRGRSLDVAFCPERIAEGKAVEELVSLPQIVGGVSEQAARRAELLFGRLGVATIRTTAKEAELAKLFTNTWRYLKFAVANQFFVIAEEAGVDYDRVLHAVRHDYPRAADLPGPGFAAGPCLLKDTMQLSAFDGHNFVLGDAARLVNEGLPEFLVRKLDAERMLAGHAVAILGMAFKAESDDTRASLSYKLKRLLWFAGAKVACTDPYVQAPDIVPLEKALSDAEVVIVGAPHPAYRGLDVGDRRLVDVWGVVDGKIRP